MFTPADLTLLASRGITPERAQEQLDRFASGFPYLTIIDSARPGRGIMTLNDDETRRAVERWRRYLADHGEVFKFVPASGAASRMFKALFEFVDSESDTPATGSPVEQLIADIDRLPFRHQLDEAAIKMWGKDVASLLGEGRNRDVIAAIIRPEGLNYGQLPKALLLFHSYPEGSRTPLEEQLTEGAQTIADDQQRVNLHFTVSANHRKLFEERINEVLPATEARTGCKFNISLSEQKPSTDTLAANPDGTPFRNDDGSLLFRPGGHGALIENLNDIDAAVIFIKNIDNVVPDSRREPTIKYKEVLGGTLILAHDRIAAYLEALPNADEKLMDEVIDFCRTTLCITDNRFDTLKGDDLRRHLTAVLDRPLRVAGMVRNEGEPGGGPYIAVNADGSASPQVLESTQIDLSREENRQMMAKATHFNPVDLVCYVKRPDGSKYDLRQFVDPATGFISNKSAKGRELLAMELPGLWNGAMSHWNTIFLEVPIETFNPVKTVNDLLRPVHLA